MAHKRLTRMVLHTLVWRRPMRDLAADFGLSDVGLKKICIRNDVTPPEQGHWQRVARGDDIPVPPLGSGSPDQTIDIYGADPIRELELLPEERARMEGLLEREGEPSFKIEVPSEPASLHSITKSVRKALKASKPDDYGCLRCEEVTLPFVRVTPERLPRAMALLDSIVRAAQRRGFAWCSGTGPRWDATASLEIEGVPLVVEIFETVHRQTHRLTPEEKAKPSYWAPRYDFLSTNQFSIRRADYDVYLKDTPRQQVESRLNELFTVLINRAFKTREENRQREIRAAQAAAREAKREEIEKLKRVEKAAFDRLVSGAGDWRKTQELRAFIDAVEARELLDAEGREARARWLEWARGKAAALDPFSNRLGNILDVDFDALQRLDDLQRN